MRHRVLAITQDADDPATRYRLTQYIPYLSAHGVDVTAVVWPRAWRARRPVVDRAYEFDSVVVFRRLLSLGDLNRLRRASRWLAYDFDDAVMCTDSTRGRPWPLLDKVIRFRAMVRCADSLTPGNAYLADLAAPYARGCAIQIVPTTLELSRFPTERVVVRAASRERAAGWIGQSSTSHYLRSIRGPLADACREHPDLIVRCITSAPVDLDGVRSEFRPWSMDGEIGELARLDVGLAPLPEDTWTSGKCGLRLLQYLASHVPAVASEVGVQAEIARCRAALPVRHASEWKEQIAALLNDPDLCGELARAGRDLVERHYVPGRWLPELLTSWCGKQPASGQVA